MLYFPERASVEAMATGPLRPWPSATEFRGLVAEPVGAATATAVVFHGNGGHVGHRLAYATALTRHGVRAVLAEYPGYGPRSGAIGERSLVDDAEETLRRAERQYGAPLLVIGESLGSGVAAAAASRRGAATAGLMLITPWDRLERVAGHHYPFLPVRWLLRDRYDSAGHLAAYPRPTLVVVAADDRTVPSAFGVDLHGTLTGPKRLTVIPAAGHNDWLDRVDDAWWAEAIAFLLGAVAR